jgi:hypothetical protein
MNSAHTSCREARATQTIARLYEAEAEQNSSYCPVRAANIRRWAKYLENSPKKPTSASKQAMPSYGSSTLVSS